MSNDTNRDDESPCFPFDWSRPTAQIRSLVSLSTSRRERGKIKTRVALYTVRRASFQFLALSLLNGSLTRHRYTPPTAKAMSTSTTTTVPLCSHINRRLASRCFLGLKKPSQKTKQKHIKSKSKHKQDEDKQRKRKRKCVDVICRCGNSSKRK